MAIWNTLGIAPTSSEDDIGYAYVHAVCRALDQKDYSALPILQDAYDAALQSARKDLPLEKEAASPPKSDSIARLTPLFLRSQALAESRADEDAWLEFTASPSFLALQDDPHLIEWLEWLSGSLYPGMASALYAAYGFSSSRALTVHPGCEKLRQLLVDYCRLPVEAIPFLYQQDILRLTLSTLKGIASLLGEPQSVHLWQQVFQLSDFIILKNQPHFLLALGRFVSSRKLSGECLFTLAEACSEEIRLSPCAEELAARLPACTAPQAWPQPDLFAGFLLQGNTKEFFEGARGKIFFLLERTAENFRNSQQRHPWDYVLSRPQFSLVKHDPVFLERLFAFSESRTLPHMFWQALHDAYLEDFLKLKKSEEDAPLIRLREMVRTKLMSAPVGPERVRRWPFLSPRVLGAGAVVYLAASLWLCFLLPWVGIPLLLAPLLLLFLF